MSMAGRGGFSLVELVLAGALALLVFAALLSVQTTVITRQQKEWRSSKFSTDALYAVEHIKNSLVRASVLVDPGSGAISSRLFGYINVNPDDGSALIKAAEQKYFLYCFSSDAGALYEYSGTYPPGLTLTPFYCGKPPEPGQTREILAGGLKNASVDYSFSRDPRNSNMVVISYSMSCGGVKISGNTAVSLQKSL